MKKKAITALMSLALIGTMTVSALATDGTIAAPSEPKSLGNTSTIANQSSDPEYSLEINGQELEENVYVMVPLRTVAEALGFSVTWNNGSILVDNGTIYTQIFIGVDSYIIATSNKDLVGMSAPFSLGTAPYITDGVTYVPLELFDALLGNGTEAILLEGNKIIIQTENTQIANPFITCKTTDEAKQIAGFPISLPVSLPGWVNDTTIRATKSGLIEILYCGDHQTIRLRKAIGDTDISGDYNCYDEVNTVYIDDLQVTLKGTDGKVNVAAWTTCGYTYAISTSSAMDQEDVLAWIGAVQ